MRAVALIVCLPLLSACTGESDLASPREVISESGGETIILDNGVCIKVEPNGEHTRRTRVAPINCQR